MTRWILLNFLSPVLGLISENIISNLPNVGPENLEVNQESNQQNDTKTDTDLQINSRFFNLNQPLEDPVILPEDENQPTNIEVFRREHWAINYICPKQHKFIIYQKLYQPFTYDSKLDYNLASLTTCQTNLNKSSFTTLFGIIDSLDAAERNTANYVLPLYLNQCKNHDVTDFIILVRLMHKINANGAFNPKTDASQEQHQHHMFNTGYFVDWFCDSEKYEADLKLILATGGQNTFISNPNLFKLSRNYQVKFSSMPVGLSCDGVNDGEAPIELTPGKLAEFYNDFSDAVCNANPGTDCRVTSGLICQTNVNGVAKKRKRREAQPNVGKNKFITMNFNLVSTSSKTTADSYKVSQTFKSKLKKVKTNLGKVLVKFRSDLEDLGLEIEENLVQDTDLCLENQCQNGSICREIFSSYFCDCEGLDFEGKFCEVEGSWLKSGFHLD